jgi:hypothetical protein
MVLPVSPNQISFNDIRIELNVPSQASFNLRSASVGFYEPLQQCQSPFPNTATPDAIGEWHGYNHSATASLTINVTTDYTSSNCTDACAGLEVGNDSLQAYTRDSSNYFGNTTCTTGLTAGYYAVVPRSTGCYTVAGSPASVTLSACATTTTTTTTTLATGTCYQVINTSGVSTPTLEWTSIDGTPRTATTAVSTTYYICSSVLPTEQGGAADLTITNCTNAGATPCSITCTSLACKQCADGSNCF